MEIETSQGYSVAMIKIDALMKVGEDKLTDAQAEELRTLALAAYAYEKSVYEIPAPQS